MRMHTTMTPAFAAALLLSLAALACSPREPAPPPADSKPVAQEAPLTAGTYVVAVSGMT